MVIICVKSVSVICAELSMLSETSWQIWVGQVVPSKANQVCMILLQARNCTLPVVSTCTASHSAILNAAQAPRGAHEKAPVTLAVQFMQNLIQSTEA